MPDQELNGHLAWRFILGLSGIVGSVFAGLTITGWIHGWEGRVALILFVLVGLVVARHTTYRPALHGFAAGFLTVFLAVELQAAFLPVYFANNPDYALIEIPFGLSARFATAIFAPVHATIGGLLTAAIVWMFSNIRRRNSS